MFKHTLSCATAGVLLASVFAAPADAALNRTFVSGKGTDSGVCALAAPCRTFTFALTQTNAGGEIDVLDPAGYGPVTITQAVSIVNDGVGTASILQGTAGQNAITISAGANDSVYLRGLNIDGLGVATDGIHMTSGGSLTVVNCVTRHFHNSGIVPISSSGTIKVFISNTIASDNGDLGIFLLTNGTGSITSVISQTTAANNGNEGIEVANRGGASASATLVDSIAVNNGFAGFYAGGTGATMRLSRSVSTSSGVGVFVEFGAVVESFGDNNLRGNAGGSVSGGGSFTAFFGQ